MNKTLINGNKLVNEMTVVQLSRWLALYEGVNIIADHAKKEGKQFNTMQIKQSALEHYVDITSDIIYRKII